MDFCIIWGPGTNAPQIRRDDGIHPSPHMRKGSYHFINEVAFSPVNLQSTPAHTSPLTSSRCGFAEPPFSVLLPCSQPAIQCPQCPNPSSLLHGIFPSCPCALPLHPLTHCMQGLSHTIPCFRPDTVKAALSASTVGKD